MTEIIDHPGIIKEIKDKQTLIVSIVSTSACNHCSSKEACTMSLGSEAKEKEVEVLVNDTSNYTIGKNVIVQMNQSNGNLAVMLSYVVPLLVMIISVFVAYGLSHNEAIAGLLGLVSLVLYYLMLYFFNSKIKKRFQFRLKD
ncbi:MAG: SoxR reducing system RseC family protein [Bacteroidales bacterium]|nr:SoxR reducing system RseC family protein [Bacteroidales bacterium]